MNSVTFSSSLNFEKDLLDASRANDIEEISRMVTILNSNVYTNHIELSNELLKLLDEFDPIDKNQTIETVFDKLSPEHKHLFTPVNVIISSRKKKQQSFGCFSKT